MDLLDKDFKSACVKGLQNYLEVHDSLERLTELRKVILMITVYYREKIPIKIQNGKRYKGQVPRETRQKLLAVFPLELCGLSLQ